jgi:prepilin-type processing-associated H-X9-DG protein
MDSDVRNILAYEKVVGSEGTAVLYLDGHAEWVSLEQLEAELAQTGERLGRDLPVEYGE